MNACCASSMRVSTDFFIHKLTAFNKNPTLNFVQVYYPRKRCGNPRCGRRANGDPFIFVPAVKAAPRCDRKGKLPKGRDLDPRWLSRDFKFGPIWSKTVRVCGRCYARSAARARAAEKQSTPSQYKQDPRRSPEHEGARVGDAESHTAPPTLSLSSSPYPPHPPRTFHQRPRRRHRHRRCQQPAMLAPPRRRRRRRQH